MPVPTVALAPGLTVSAQGYGAMSVSPAYGPVDLDEALAALHRAVDLGITFVDTADVYGDGTSERVVGKLLKDRGDEVQVATKFGLVGALGTGNRGIDGRPEYAKRAIDESLSRLGVDSVDLYYLHRVDPTVPIEDTVGALAELVQAGKIRHIGLSEATGDELRRAHAVHPIAAIQSDWADLIASALRVAKDGGELDSGADVEQLTFEINGMLAQANTVFLLYGDRDAFDKARRAIHGMLARAGAPGRA